MTARGSPSAAASWTETQLASAAQVSLKVSFATFWVFSGAYESLKKFVVAPRFNGMDAPARHGIGCAKVEVSSNH
jgi:hypothetical protein